MTNRQARLPGDSEWTDFGDVTLEQAAIEKAKELPFGIKDSVIVFVRDSEVDKTFTVSVGAKLQYFVEGLRGGDL